MAMLVWKKRHFVWSNWLTLRHNLNKPQDILPPTYPDSEPTIQVVDFKDKYEHIPLHIPTYATVPSDEDRLAVNFVRFTTLNLTKVFSPMQSGLPQIPEDQQKALDSVLTNNYVKAFKRPVLPDVFANIPPGGVADLTELAVASPYSTLLAVQEGQLVWDLTHFSGVEHHAHCLSLSLKVVFAAEKSSTRLQLVEIQSEAFGTTRAGDSKWNDAVRLAICSASTHTSITRHFHYVHLICSTAFAVASRNILPKDHPLFRLLWPSNFNSIYTNFGITEVQLLPDGDFTNMFSLTHKGLMQLYNKMHSRYRVSYMDPFADWKDRGLDEYALDAPSQRNVEELFTIIHEHSKRYMDIYYKSDEELQADEKVITWLKRLNELIPNGLSAFVEAEKPTLEGVAHLIGAVIYEGNTTHDMVGTTMWDYQLWAHDNPLRMHEDGSRVALDVLHRAVMNNFGLQLVRAPLLADYKAVALDEEGGASWTKLYEDCVALQQKYDEEPAGLWRMEPKNLEISMNG